MAFKSKDLVSSQSLGTSAGLWFYDTEDDVTSANYFGPAANYLSLGDRIMVTVFTNLGKSNEAYASHSEVVVTAVSSTAATVTVE